jgi:hypothetical protein
VKTVPELVQQDYRNNCTQQKYAANSCVVDAVKAYEKQGIHPSVFAVTALTGNTCASVGKVHYLLDSAALKGEVKEEVFRIPAGTKLGQAFEEVYKAQLRKGIREFPGEREYPTWYPGALEEREFQRLPFTTVYGFKETAVRLAEEFPWAETEEARKALAPEATLREVEEKRMRLKPSERVGKVFFEKRFGA